MLTSALYTRAREIAMSNSHEFHLAAILFRRKSIVRIGTNSLKTSPRFKRIAADGSQIESLHAEMDVLRFSLPGDRLVVLRFTHNCQLALAKPCKHCQKLIRDFGIINVMYSDFDGTMKKLKM